MLLNHREQAGHDRKEHGAHGAFHHGQAGRPGFITCFQEIIPGEADQVVLVAFHAIAEKFQRLVGYHFQLGGDPVGGFGDGQGAGIGTFGGGVVGFGDHQPVLPDRAVHLFWSEPGLRCQLHHKLGGASGLDGTEDLPGVGSIGLFHITVECCFTCPKGDGTEK